MTDNNDNYELNNDKYELNNDERDYFIDNVSDDTKMPFKLDYRVLISVSIGILVVFILMLFVNAFIFSQIIDEKSAYYLSIIASNVLFILVVLSIKLSKKLKWTELGYNGSKFFIGVKDVFKVWGITWIIHIAYMIVLMSAGLTPPENELMELLQKPTLIYLIINILIIAVAAPFIEETLFRGILFGSMRPYLGTWAAIIISAAIFSALHFEIFGFVPRFALGIGLGYLYVKHQSIYPSVLLHALNNLLAVLFISLFS